MQPRCGSLPMGAFLRDYNHLQTVTLSYVIYNIPVHRGHFKLLLCVVKNMVITQYTGEDHLQIRYLVTKDKVHLNTNRSGMLTLMFRK